MIMLRPVLLLFAAYYIRSSSSFVSYHGHGREQPTPEETRARGSLSFVVNVDSAQNAAALLRRPSQTAATVQSTSVAPICSSVTRPEQARSASSYWEQLAPNLWQDEQGVDVRLTWNTTELAQHACCSSPEAHVARDFLDEIEDELGSRQLSGRHEMEQELQTWMESFVDYCHKSLSPFHGRVTARIVSSRGAAGTKCPRWHLDHVSFRWIHAIVGPGCEWVDMSSVDKGSQVAQEIMPLFSQTDSDDDDDDDGIDAISTRQINDRRLDPMASLDLKINQARPGEAVLLLGNEWRTTSISNCDLDPVIHKSPADILPWQGRVVFTMDIVPEDE